MLASELVTAIRKLILDESSNVFTDTQILRVIGLVQQDFCTRSECHVVVLRIAAPPQYQYSFTFDWEEGMLSDERIFKFPFGDYRWKATQPWELEEDFAQNVSGGNTLTGGVDLEQVDPQMPMPYPLGPTAYKVLALIWDYKWVEEKSRRWLEDTFRDFATKRGDVVDYFTFNDELRKDNLLFYGMPYTFSDITSLTYGLPIYVRPTSGISCPYGYSYSNGLCVLTTADGTLTADIGYVFAVGVPSTPVSYTTFELNRPFIKYVGFGSAAQLLSADTELRNPTKAAHFSLRYEVGISLSRRVAKRGLSYKKFRAGDRRVGYMKTSLSRPRLPDHYPRNPVCR